MGITAGGPPRAPWLRGFAAPAQDLRENGRRGPLLAGTSFALPPAMTASPVRGAGPLHRGRVDKRGRILVVDDEANARTALAELLREEGYDVETAADAFKALGKLEEYSPHLLLTDLKMPGMDGIELMKRLAAGEREVAVVVMTAFGAVDTAVEAMRAGAVDYLTKPLNFDELLLVV